MLTDRLKVLYHPTKWSNLHTAFLEPVWDQYIDRVPIIDSDKHSPQNCVVLTHALDTDWTQEWIENGFKIIIDNTWESHTAPQIPESLQIRHLNHFNWHRIVEPLWYKSLGYTKYVKNPKYTNTFLMLMNRVKPHRTSIYKNLTPLLDNAIYSYNQARIPLQHSVDMCESVVEWQRYINYDWFNHTAFSVVVETRVQVNTTNQMPWISEKGFKPIAFEHPFVAWAPPGYLRSLHELGFKTFDHLIDESYDTEIDNTIRLKKICEIVNDLVSKVRDCPGYFQDDETIFRLRHNRSLFYNWDIVRKDFETNIIKKIVDFGNE